MPDPATQTRAAAVERHERAVQRVRYANTLFFLWLGFTILCILSAAGYITFFHVRPLVPLIQVFTIIPAIAVVGLFRESVANARRDLLEQAHELACLSCWYPAPETDEDSFRCHECGELWSTATVRDYLSPPVSYAHIPKPMSEAPPDA